MHRLSIREGWSTVFLTSAVVFISVWSILRADWADGLRILNLITLAGLGLGLAVAKTRQFPAFVVHSLAMLAGVVIILYQMTEYLDDRLGTRRQKLSWLWDRGSEWATQISTGERTDDLYLFVLFVSILSFLLAYTSMWLVIRARWIWAALVLPGLLLFINLGYSLRVPTSYVAFYLFFAILLLMRFSLLQRELTWRRMRIAYPSSVVWHGMWAATYLGVAIILFGWAFPASARSADAHDVWLKVDDPWRSVEAQFNEWFAGLRGPGGGGIGGYASFEDSFDLGGPLRLSDAPVVVVNGQSRAPYLAAHRYSTYTGRGWESELTQDIDETETAPPQLELAPGEEVPLDHEATPATESKDYTIQVQRPRGTIVFAPETFLSADIGVNLALRWMSVNDARIVLTGNEPVDAPHELQPLITLLREADFTPEPPEPTPTPSATAGTSARATPATPTTPEPLPPAPASPEIRAAIQALAEQEIRVDYTIDQNTYKADMLVYAGTFPIYDEVEAVFAREGLASGSEYTVTALESTALSDDLRQAPEEYSDAILGRYLQLPETVTPRTKELALEITANATTPFDRARAVENWLRTNIAYSENVEFPPEDQDVVDYVLFDSRQGYCEYYASSFVVLMRSLGIPTRMVTGFFPADHDDSVGGFLYRERNAHAWPEVYFAGYGWIPFEPTANRAEIPRDPVQASNNATSDTPLPTGGGDFLPDDEEFLAERGGGFAGAVDGAVNREESVTRAEWALRIGFLLLMFATLVVTYLWLRGIRGLTPAGQLYTKTARGASWGGIRREPSMTPHEYAQLVARTVPGSRAPAHFLTDLYVGETYGARKPTQADLLRARHAWARLRGLLLKHLVLRLRPWTSQRADNDDEIW